MLDVFQTYDVPGFDRVRIVSQRSVSSVEPAAHVFLVNEAFDEEFASDVTTALKNLRSRIYGSVA